MKKEYDYVFFDAPPIVGVSDASVLCSQVDGVLLVIQHRRHPRGVALRAKTLIQHAGGKMMGVVLNNINLQRDYSYYYQQYSYSYTTYGKDSGSHTAVRPKKETSS